MFKLDGRLARDVGISVVANVIAAAIISYASDAAGLFPLHGLLVTAAGCIATASLAALCMPQVLAERHSTGNSRVFGMVIAVALCGALLVAFPAVYLLHEHKWLALGGSLLLPMRLRLDYRADVFLVLFGAMTVFLAYEDRRDARINAGELIIKLPAHRKTRRRKRIADRQAQPTSDVEDLHQALR